MTTYPGAAEPMSAGVLAGGTTISHRTEHGRTIGIWENARHHGAVADATLANYQSTGTDDTAALQAGLDAAAGTAFLIPPGGYRITAPLVVPSGTVVRGSSPGKDYTGIGTRILVNNTSGDPAFLVSGPANRVAFRDLHIISGNGEGIKLAGDSGHIINPTIIDNVHFAGVGDATHFLIKGVWALETYIQNCTATGSGGGGIYLGDTCNASVVRDNTFSNGGGVGALGGMLVEANGCLIEGNVFEAWNGAYGIKIANAVATNSVIRNWFEDNDGIGIWDAGGNTNTTILGNNVSGNANCTYGIKVSSSRGVYIGGNTVDAGAGAGLALTSTATANLQTTAILSHNTIFGATTGNIDISGLLNTKDSVIRLGEARRDAFTSPAPVEVVTGNVRLGASSIIEWGSALDTATAETRIYIPQAKTIGLNPDNAFMTGKTTHGALPAASSYPAGSMYYCTTDKKPVWSDGSAHWVDAAGANHT